MCRNTGIETFEYSVSLCTNRSWDPGFVGDTTSRAHQIVNLVLGRMVRDIEQILLFRV